MPVILSVFAPLLQISPNKATAESLCIQLTSQVQPTHSSGAISDLISILNESVKNSMAHLLRQATFHSLDIYLQTLLHKVGGRDLCGKSLDP